MPTYTFGVDGPEFESPRFDKPADMGNPYGVLYLTEKQIFTQLQDTLEGDFWFTKSADKDEFEVRKPDGTFVMTCPRDPETGTYGVGSIHWKAIEPTYGKRLEALHQRLYESSMEHSITSIEYDVYRNAMENVGLLIRAFRAGEQR